jgi:hypothetical protein
VADWEFILCESPDPKNPTGPLQRICPIVSTGDTNLEIVRNRAGSFQCAVDINSEAAYKLLDRVNLGDVRGSIRKCVVAKRNKKWMWSGPVSALNGNISGEGGTLQINGVGWLELLYQREFHQDVTFNGALPQDFIVWLIIGWANDQDQAYPCPVQMGGNYGNMLPRTNFTVTRGEKMGEAIQRLSDVESGFDMDVDPVTRKLYLYAWDSYRVNTNAKLGYHWGPNNIESVQWVENGMATRTRITAIGKSGTIPPPGFDVGAADEYGIWEETVNLTDAPDDILQPYMAAELVYRSRPVVQYTIVPKVNAESPRLFDDFQIGEQIFFNAREGAFKVENQGIRVFGASITVDSEMNEKVTNLQTTPASA